jgi:serine phosphatase RsbU (regulator of sigma subunit)
MERLEHDMKVARSIQQSLLPSNAPVIKGFDVAGWNLPADETGGDFYDWQVFPNGNLVIVLADVTGHGLGPAILAAVCRAYARANLSIQDGLLTAMKRINAALSQDLSPGRFATLVAAICTPDSSRVELLSAGHGPLFIYLLREDRIESMGAQGLPLGIMPVLSSDPPDFLELSPGDLLVLATDGLYEWENAHGEQFGPKRLEDVIRRVRGSPPQEIIEALYKAVLEFSGGTKQQDDLTAVIIKRA